MSSLGRIWACKNKRGRRFLVIRVYIKDYQASVIRAHAAVSAEESYNIQQACQRLQFWCELWRSGVHVSNWAKVNF